MNGFITKTVAGVCLTAGLAALNSGCCRYREVVDPCWPERYNHQARYTVLNTWNAQAHNGHTHDQTIWNWQFETDPKTGAPTDKLNPAGIAHLTYIIRRTPMPDTRVYVQTAQDVKYDHANPDKATRERVELDTRRQQAIHNYLAFATGGKGAEYQILVVDPGEPGMAALPLGGSRQALVLDGSVQQMYMNFKGVMPGGSGGSSVSSSQSSSTSSSGSGSSSGGSTK